MSENEIDDLLHRHAERVRVSAPPVESMVAAVRQRRRRTWVGAGAAAAVLTVVGATVLTLSGAPGEGPDRPVATGPTGATGATGAVTPDGFRVVGAAGIGVMVPEQWPDDDTWCGTPRSDTVVVDRGVTCLALVPRDRGVEEVEVVRERPQDFRATTTVEVGGVTAERQATSCEEGFGGRRAVRVCRGVLWIPSHDVGVVATSSTGDDERATGEVESMLQRVRLLTDQEVPVPGRHDGLDLAESAQDEWYREQLTRAGLAVEVVTRRDPGVPAGFLLDVQPRPGTVLAPGETVTMTVAAAPQGPLDEVHVGLNSDTAGWDTDFGEAEVRAGATVRLSVGDSIWAYAEGKRSGTLAGRLEGNSLAQDGWVDGPNHPHSWKAVRQGRTEVVLTITADGKKLEVGRVTVVVR